MYHWVKFTAKANHDYETRYEIVDKDLYVTIVDMSTGNISSETIGNYVNLPDKYKLSRDWAWKTKIGSLHGTVNLTFLGRFIPQSDLDH